MKPTIYIAAKFSKQQELRRVTKLLCKSGVIVTSSWIFEDEKDFHEITDEFEHGYIAFRDAHDIQDADIVVIDTREELSKGGGGGREFEAGYGYALKGVLWRVGPARSPFHYLAGNSWKTWKEFIKWAQNQA